MPSIRSVDVQEARKRLRHSSPGEVRHAPYRAAIVNLAADRMLEVEPDEGESLRVLKMRVSRAARDVGRRVGYGVTKEETLLVWLEVSRYRRGPRRGQEV